MSGSSKKRAASSNVPSKTNQGAPKTAKSRLKLLEAAAKADCKIVPEISITNQVPWVDKHFPTNLDELFVNKKKVEEVQSWLSIVLEPPNGKPFPAFRKISKICVLSGPSGSGKTATIMVLAKHFNITVKEWINPASLTDFDANKVFVHEDEITGRSQADLFTNFILRSSQYSTLPIKGRKLQSNCVTLVEDFPNVFYRDPSLFHNLLRNLRDSTSPLVFVLGDSSASDGSANKLFPKNVREELGIQFITFNAIATTFMVKFLTLICGKEDIGLHKTTLEEIATVSGGDIRSAINALQFAHQKTRGAQKKSTFKKPLPFPAKGANKKGESAKDESLFLFHALGKVLYGKRNTKEVSRAEYDLVARHNEEKRIYPLANSPEEMCSMIEVSAEMFIYFLQQNFVQFFTSVEECAKASAHIADAENILSTWAFDVTNSEKTVKVKESKEEVALSVATRGIMHSNTKPVSQAWKPLRKPICNDLHKQIQKCVDSYLFLSPVSSECLLTNYYVDYFPYFAKIKGSSLTGEKRTILQKTSLGLTVNKYRADDTEVEDLQTSEETHDVINLASSTGENDEPVGTLDDEMDFNIEEYDD